MADNHHVQIAGSQISCGIGQLWSLTSDPEKILYALATHLYHPSRGQPYAAVIWSDTEQSNGCKLFESINSLFRGSHLWGSNWIENPKTSNLISMYYWELPHKEFRQWYIEQRVKRAQQI